MSDVLALSRVSREVIDLKLEVITVPLFTNRNKGQYKEESLRSPVLEVRKWLPEYNSIQLTIYLL